MPEPESEQSRIRRLEEVTKITTGVFEEFGVVQHEEHGNLLPLSLRTRNAKGEIEEVPFLLMCPRPEHRFKARRKSRERARDEYGLDPRREGEDAQDKDYVNELERLEVLSYAIRENDQKNPSQMYPDGAALQQAVPNYRVLEEVNTALDKWVLMNDPRYGDLDGEDLWRVIAEVARTGTTRPLWFIGGLEQDACIVLSARGALLSPMNPLSKRRSSTSSSESGAPSSGSAEA
jgi:hypothetical protein